MDIYALAPHRTVTAVEQFLARYLPDRRACADEYEVPAYSPSPVVVFTNPDELIAYCCEQPEAEQRIYWLNHSSGDPHSAHIFFLRDGGLVFGLSIASNDETTWDGWLKELLIFTQSDLGYWICECPPASSTHAFASAAQQWRDSRDGVRSHSDTAFGPGRGRGL